MLSRHLHPEGRVSSAGTVESIKKLVSDLNDASVPSDVEVVIAPAFIHLYQVLQSIKPDIKVAAQNCWSTHMGAYTGEVARPTLKVYGHGLFYTDTSKIFLLCIWPCCPRASCSQAQQFRSV